MCVGQSLVGQPSAQALLDLDNTAINEPFNSLVTFGCIPPGKRYRPVEELSGGEKTMAALALVFAMQSYDTHFLFFTSTSFVLLSSFLTLSVNKMCKKIYRWT